MKVAIIIPAINLWNKYSKPCIDSVKTKHDYRILFIDHQSDDETIVEAGKLVSNTFSHKRNEERWCCAKTWNFGIRDAIERGYEHILILNNDVLLHPDCIDRMVERFKKEGLAWANPKPLGMVSAMDIRGDCPNPTDVFSKLSEDYKDVPESEHPNFSAFMITKQCFEAVGPFDENFVPCYFEDNDYHYRMKLAGYKAIVYPPALFYHYGSRTQNEATDKPICSSPMFENNRAHYNRKWGGDPGKEGFIKPFNNN